MNKQAIYEMVDEMLDSEGPIMIGSLEFYRSDILKRLDPVAYREVALELVNSHIDDLLDDLSRYEHDEDEREFIQERLAELEDF
jgi:hypothetical protein